MELPEHLLVLILIWLPVKSLLRFKSVCKYWYALIKSSNFINHHLLHNNCSSSSSSFSCSIISKGLICWKTKPHCEFISLSGDLFENLVHLDFAKDQLGSYKSSILVGQLTFVNSCNGIICLHTYFSPDVTLWNPATKQLRPLPLPPIAPRSSFPRKFVTTPLFGFDVRTKDYKVAIFIEKKDEPWDDKPNSVVQVYNLSTDSWRIIHKDFLLPFDNISTSRPNVVYKNGICFCCGTYKSNEFVWKHWVLISFNFTTEVIRTTLMPVPDTHDTICMYALDFFDDNIVCLSRGRWEKHTYDKWVLHGYGTVNESWTKLYTYESFPDIRPIKFSKNKDFLVLGINVGALFLCNLVTQEMQDLDPSCIGEFVFYNESLVSIKGLIGGADREICLFLDTSEDDYESEKEEGYTEEERDESDEENESPEDREIKEDLEKKILNELDVGLKLEFEPSSSK
ncbi:hypothetical protein AQUCO_02400039v1 [Aquilegia coerulea]|uniref:F-box domain-containing protein n=1 Tax=Aquilegia coerulea TaxID=218851 RepID=A0A2G5DAZ7_AQUCA|nr:hypothetical protein AQUCO_02400039v1 [Aquilegia coerulea]